MNQWKLTAGFCKHCSITFSIILLTKCKDFCGYEGNSNGLSKQNSQTCYLLVMRVVFLPYTSFYHVPKCRIKLHIVYSLFSLPFRCVLSCKNFNHWFPLLLGGDTRSSSSSFRYCTCAYERDTGIKDGCSIQKYSKQHKTKPLTWPTRSTLKYFPLRSNSSSFCNTREKFNSMLTTNSTTML